jgi:hypothetical protein
LVYPKEHDPGWRTWHQPLDWVRAAFDALDAASPAALPPLPSSTSEVAEPARHGTATPTDSRPRLTEAESNIIAVVRDAGHRLVTDEIVAELEHRCGAASLGTTKQYLAGLTRRGLLTNRQDVDPKGYGLPEWG